MEPRRKSFPPPRSVPISTSPELKPQKVRPIGTIQAGLAWDFNSSTLSPDLDSDRAVELAGKEIIAMTTTTKAAWTVGLTVGGLVAGLGGASFLSSHSGGKAEAAGIMTAMSVVQEASHEIEPAAFTVEPTSKSEAEPPETPVPLNSNVASDKAVASGDDPPTRWDLKSNSPAEKRIVKELQAPTEVDFDDIPLKDALSYIISVHHIQVLDDFKQLSDEGISTDTSVTLHLSGVSLKSALRLLLEPLQLDYIIQNDVLMITTLAKANETLATRVYSIGRLTNISPEELAEVITATVAPGEWNVNKPAKPAAAENPQGAQREFGSDRIGITTDGARTPMVRLIPVQFGMGGMGGGGVAHINPAVDPAKGSIRVLKNTLVIRQTQRIHEEVVELLDQLMKQQTSESF